MITFSAKITLFLALVGWASAEELGSSAAAFQRTQIETPGFSEVIKELSLEPLIQGDSTNVVRWIGGGGWFNYVMTIQIPAVREKPAVAEFKLASFDAHTNRNVIKSVSADLTPGESAALQDALSSSKSFNKSQPNGSSPAIDSGWSFIEMQTATDYKWVLLRGPAGRHPDSKKLTTALFEIEKRVLSDTDKARDHATSPSKRNW